MIFEFILDEIKRCIAFLGTHLLYYIGNKTCDYMFKDRDKKLSIFWMNKLYYIYNKCMVNSLKIQNWGGLESPCIKPESKFDKRKRIVNDVINEIQNEIQN